MKVAIIGEGFGAKYMAPAFRYLGWETQVVAPRDAAGIRAACAADVDLVSVHSPPFLHHDHVMWALDHRRPVLCDKPFGRNAAEARAMCDRAHDLDVPNFLNYEFRRQPSRAKIKEVLDSGAIGTLQHISWNMIGSGLRGGTHRWLFDASQAGGWIGAYGSHAIDSLRWLFGSEVADCGGISRIEVKTRPDRDGVDRAATAEDAFSVWFLMANGSTVSFDTAYAASLFLPSRMVLLGSAGALELTDEKTIVLRRPGAADEAVDWTAPPQDMPGPASLTLWLDEVTQALRTGERLSPSFDDGLAAAVAMDRLRANLVHAGR